MLEKQREEAKQREVDSQIAAQIFEEGEKDIKMNEELEMRRKEEEKERERQEYIKKIKEEE